MVNVSKTAVLTIDQQSRVIEALGVDPNTVAWDSVEVLLTDDDKAMWVTYTAASLSLTDEEKAAVNSILDEDEPVYEVDLNVEAKIAAYLEEHGPNG